MSEEWVKDQGLKEILQEMFPHYEPPRGDNLAYLNNIKFWLRLYKSEMDNARKVAVDLWCSEGLPTEHWQKIKQYRMALGMDDDS